jgi:hypothetical protein
VHPPAAGRITLDATRAAGRDRWVDGCTHAASLPVPEAASIKTLNQADSIKMSKTKCVGVTSRLW